MGNDTTPGQTGSIFCIYCGGSIFFVFNGGPHQIPCPERKRMVSVEVVYDGRKWKTKVRREPSR